MIEDEPDLAEIVGYSLRREGYEFHAFAKAKEGMEYLRNHAADLLLLDIMLPDGNGFEMCRLVRSAERTKHLPIVFLTARGEEYERILGLELGADDYIVKPFSPRELTARIRAVLRRQDRAPGPSEVVTIRGLRLDASTHDVSVDGRQVSLSALEFRLLFFLASHPRQIFTRDRLLVELWGHDCTVTPRTIDVHIRRLREKVEALPEKPEYIGTVRGVGYRLLGDPEVAHVLPA